MPPVLVDDDDDDECRSLTGVEMSLWEDLDIVFVGLDRSREINRFGSQTRKTQKLAINSSTDYLLSMLRFVNKGHF